MRDDTTTDRDLELPLSASDIAIDPADLLRLVNSARVELTVPLVEGTILPGLSVRPGTVAHIEATVREGALDTDGARVEILPPLDGRCSPPSRTSASAPTAARRSPSEASWT